MTDRYISPFSNTNLLATDKGHLSPIQQWAVDLLVRGLIHEQPVTTNDLTTAFKGLATMADRGLAVAMNRFLEINDPYRTQPLHANSTFAWEIPGPNGFAGTISDINEVIEIGTDGLGVYNVAVMPFPSAPEGVWYDSTGNKAYADYGDTLREFMHLLDPLLLVHIDQDFKDALLDLQREVACDLLEIARPIVRTDVVCHSSTFGRLWEYSGPIGLLQETPPPFDTLPGGDLYLSDGRGHALGDRSFLSIADPGDTGTNLQRLDLLVKQVIGNHLTTDTVVEELVPQGVFGWLSGKTEWRTTTFPSPMARLQLSCAQLQVGLLDLGIDPVTAAASAYSWLIGMKCATRKVGINV